VGPAPDLVAERSANPDVIFIRPLRHNDARGFFSEVYSRRAFAAAGIDIEFVQDNYSRSVEHSIVRGLHFQVPPFAQHKLVWVTRGAIFGVAVDLRWGSATYGRPVTRTIDAESGLQWLVPAGFAHGYCTLEPNTDVAYKVSAYFSPEHDRGLLWNDPALGVEWPIAATEAILSKRSRQNPPLAELPRYFTSER
jgi:dTDP-4-dehydrorhamnose 3,5-epimerase